MTNLSAVAQKSSLSAVAQKSFAYYLAKADPIGRNAAAAIVGVLNYESKLDPNAHNDTGTDAGGVLNSKGAIGVAQWNGDRQGALLKFATEKGLNWQDIATQLDFVLTECANSYKAVWAAIQGNGDAADIVSIFVRSYENPAKPEPEIAGALETAQALLDMVPSPAPVIAPTPPPSPAPVIASPDPEIAALEALYAIMLPFPAAARSRMTAYLTARLAL